VNGKPTTYEHIKSIIQLPFVATVLVPLGIIYFSHQTAIIPLEKIPIALSYFMGFVFLIIGFIIFIRALSLFIKIGNGTLAPWNPTKKMIIHGMYRHVRNPMLIGVNFILLGETFLLHSGNILIWTILFIIINTIYFV